MNSTNYVACKNLQKMCKSGIYTIVNVIKGKGYIGSSINVYKRWSYHIYHLKNNKHNNTILQNSWNKYGKDAFEFHLIEEVQDVSKLPQREQVWLDVLLPLMPFYNIKTKAYHNEPHSEERKMKASERMLGNKYASNKSHKISEQTREKISKSLKGRTFNKKMPKGEEIKGSKLKDDEVIEIRKLYKEGVRPYKIHEIYCKVSKSVIGNIVLNKTWKHLLNKGGMS